MTLLPLRLLTPSERHLPASKIRVSECDSICQSLGPIIYDGQVDSPPQFGSPGASRSMRSFRKIVRMQLESAVTAIGAHEVLCGMRPCLQVTIEHQVDCQERWRQQQHRYVCHGISRRAGEVPRAASELGASRQPPQLVAHKEEGTVGALRPNAALRMVGECP